MFGAPGGFLGVACVVLSSLMSDRTSPLAAASFSSTAHELTVRERQNPPAASLRIVVIAGEDAVNVIQQKTAVAPIVEVRDRNDQPVAGALVTFAIQGKNATFAAGADTLSLTTNAAGQAVVTGLAPTGSGVVQINVAAAFQGQTAAATITQTNFATAAQAAAGSGASGPAGGSMGASAGGGGLGPLATTAIIGGAAGAAGGYYAYKEHADGEAPEITDTQVSPAFGIQDANRITFGFTGSATDRPAITWEYGDGARETLPPENGGPGTHTYTTSGTFIGRVTIQDKAGRTATSQTGPVTIKAMTGRWAVGSTGTFYNLTQSGSSVGGTHVNAAGQVIGTITGILGSPLSLSPTYLTIVLTITPNTGAPSTFSGNARDGTADVLIGSLSGGFASLTRQ